MWPPKAAKGEAASPMVKKTSSLCPGSNTRDAEPRGLRAGIRLCAPPCHSQGAETRRKAHQTAGPCSAQAQRWHVVLSTPTGESSRPQSSHSRHGSSPFALPASLYYLFL
ncbi:hypothetical protein NDU88_003749 [Pleurodeles waltl]|uniref:Uncharacterized protein n=1 Tax=Pleurodeles waltl TaxID=8319 RepID=A0AAV7NKP9_PLEWA|nr:hypothetical protein NDU88_003749 [Pleurodeles waltl]